MTKPKEANKKLFNKLFTEMPSVRKINKPIDEANNIKFKKSIRYLYYSKNTRLWFGFNETVNKFIYFFGIYDTHITKLNTLENSIMIDFDKKNNFNDDSLGLISDNLTVYLNKKLLEEKYPTFNSTQFQEHIIQNYTNSIKMELNTIKLGEINGNFISNLNKLIKSILKTSTSNTNNQNQNKSSKKASMNLFLNSIKVGKSYEEALKIAKIGNGAVKIWYSRGRKGDRTYKEFYDTFKEIMPRNTSITKKMNKILDLMKSGKTDIESINIANVTSQQLKEWVKKGKQGDVEYLDFYEEYKILKKKNTPKSNTKQKNKELINNYIKLINEGKTNKEAFETLNIPKFKVKNWKKQGQLGNNEYKEFYDTYLLAVKREEFNKINQFIDLINQGKSNNEAIKIIKIPTFKIKQWFNKGKNNDKDYIDFYNAYMKQYEKPKKSKIPSQNIKPTIKKDIKEDNEKKCEICGRTLHKKSKDNICKRCRRKQRCANIVQELLPSIDPGIPFKKEDLKKLGLTGMQVQDYIWTLQEFSLIVKEKNKKYSLISREEIDEFIKESGVEIKEIGKSSVKLTKTCDTCGKTLEISKFSVSENNPDGYNDTCKSCKKLISTAGYLKELLEHIEYGKEFNEEDLKTYYPDPFLLQAKILSLVDNDLLIRNKETNRYTLTDKEKCEEFIDKYFKELPQIKPTPTLKPETPKTKPKQPIIKPKSPKTKPKSKPKLTLSKKQKQMECVLKAIENGKTRKEAAKIARISLFRITHWYKEGRDGIGEDNIYFHKKLKKIESEQQNKLKNSMKVVLKVLKSGGSKRKAAKDASIEENEIDNWIKKGDKGLKPYDVFKRKYDKIYKKSIDYNDKNNIRARKIFIENIKDGKTRKESSKKASIELKLIDSWIIRGTKEEKPFDEFYKEYSEAREIAKDKPNSKEEEIKCEFVDLLKEGYSHGEASRKIENGTYKIKIKKWYAAGKQGVKNHLKFYLDCQEAKNSFRSNKNKIFTLIADGFTIKESCEKLNLNPVLIKESILKGMEGKKPHDEFYFKIIESKTSLIDISQMFKSHNHPHKNQMIDFLDLILIGTNEKEALIKINLEESTFKYWINRGKRNFGELYTEFYEIYNQIKTGELIKQSKKDIIKEIEKELDEIENEDADILNPLPKKIRMQLDNISGKTYSGFAWVNKIGDQWSYSKRIKGRNIRITDKNIYELHKKVIRNNLMWGVRDLEKAKQTLKMEGNEPINSTEKTKEHTELESNKNTEINDNNILSPLPPHIKTKFSKGTSSGFAWVSKIGNYYYYVRNNKNIRIKDSSIKKLYQKVIANNLDWGVIDLTKAKQTLNKKVEEKSKPETIKEKVNTDILSPLPKEIENELKKFSKGTSTGFAWVSKIGKKYSYSRKINNKEVNIKAETIQELHEKVLSRNLTWGVRDLTKAKQTLNEKPKTLNFTQKIPEIVNDDIFTQLPQQFEDSFKSTKINKSGIAWVNKNGNNWSYSRRINEKTVELKDPNIYNLHKKVINKNLTWGVRDFEKAKFTLISKPLDETNKYFLSPISKKLKHYVKTDTGFAFVFKKDNYWEYKINNTINKLIHNNIFGLYEQVFEKDYVWGITDIEKAKKSLEITKLPDEIIKENTNKNHDNKSQENIEDEILKPLPEHIEKKLQSLSSGTTSTGFAWVIKIGRYYAYKKRVNGEMITIKELDIYELYAKVKKHDLLWGVRDINKARKTIDKSNKRKIKQLPEEVIATDILSPLPKEHEETFKSKKINKSGIAWVTKIGEFWIYTRRIEGEQVSIRDKDIYQLYEKVVAKNLTWGVRDLTTAKQAIYGENIEHPDENLKNEKKILKPLPIEIEQKLRKNSKGNASGFAWVSKIGDKWQYTKVINGIPIHLKDSDIYKLHEIVIKNNHIWGVRNLAKAKKTLKECDKKLPKAPKIEKIPENTIQQSFDNITMNNNNNNIKFDNSDILTPLPQKYLKSFKKSKNSATGIAWVRKNGNKWLYHRNINGKKIDISDSDIYQLHNKVLTKNLPWGIINPEKAKKIIFNAQPIVNSEPEEKQTSVFVIQKGNIISIEGKIKNNEVLKVLAKIYEFGENILKMNTNKQNEETVLSIELELNPAQIIDFESEIKEFRWEIDK